MNEAKIFELNKFLNAVDIPYRLTFDKSNANKTVIYTLEFKEYKKSKYGKDTLVPITQDKVEKYLKDKFNVSLKMWDKDPFGTLDKVNNRKQSNTEKLNKLNNLTFELQPYGKTKIISKQSVIKLDKSLEVPVTKSFNNESQSLKDIIKK